MYQSHVQPLESRRLFAFVVANPSDGLVVASGAPFAPDNTALTEPTVVLKARPITSYRSTSQIITVTFKGINQVDVTTLNDRDVRVTGPLGFRRYAKFDSFIITPDGSTVVRYKLSAPGSAWNEADNGTYTVTLVENAVRDVAGNKILGRRLGSFRVHVPPPLNIGFGAPG